MFHFHIIQSGDVEKIESFYIFYTLKVFDFNFFFTTSIQINIGTIKIQLINCKQLLISM